MAMTMLKAKVSGDLLVTKGRRQMSATLKPLVDRVPGEIDRWLRHLVVASLLHLSADYVGLGANVALRATEFELLAEVAFMKRGQNL